ncbi:sensor histidine kinase [Nonomuraea spiralis]|uniref:histidine kinase n=1 Tax=Nonomuraea spiralis TaxID=46182 RepID=A0ABV5IAY9_9ACTN|nr:histidine kinase [Nonomuraea spiralis]
MNVGNLPASAWPGGRAGHGGAAVTAEVALGVAAVVVLVFWARLIAASWGGGYWVFDIAAGAAVCALALTRRRGRVWTAAAGLGIAVVAVVVAAAADLPNEPGPGMALGLSVLVGSAVRTLPARPAGAVAAGGLLVAAASAPMAHNGSVVVLNAGGWLAAVTVGGGLRLLAERRRAAADRVRHDERRRLARELHDVAAHHMTGIVLQAQAARLLARRRSGLLEESLEDIEEASTGALSALRRVVGLLREAADDVPGPPGRLTDLIDRFDGPPVTLRGPADAEDWPPEVTSTVYRIVQESLTNVARHAPRARSVTVEIAGGGGTVVVEVADDAPPTPPSRNRGGYGLLGMRERVEALDGTLRAGPRPEGGWSVRAALPLGARR